MQRLIEIQFSLIRFDSLLYMSVSLSLPLSLSFSLSLPPSLPPLSLTIALFFCLLLRPATSIPTLHCMCMRLVALSLWSSRKSKTVSMALRLRSISAVGL